MNRRMFLKMATAAVATAAIADTSVASSTLHVYGFEDGGEEWWYAAESQDAAFKMHHQLNYADAGVKMEKSPTSLGRYPDSKTLRVGDAGDEGETIVKTAAEWAAGGDGLVCSTCY